MLILSAIWISDCLSLVHIVEIRMNSLSVVFQDGSSSCYFSRKLFEFWAHANSLDHLDCSHGSLAEFCNKFFVSGSKFLSRHWRQLLELALVLIFLTIWISDCLFLAHIVKIRRNTLSILFWDGSSSSYFLRKHSKFELVRIFLIIWAAVVFVLIFFYNGALDVFFFQDGKFSMRIKAVGILSLWNLWQIT